MKIIGLDTSTETGGVAVVDGERLVAEYTLSLQRTTHSERLLPAVRQVLNDAGLSGVTASAPGAAPVDGIAVALGPGSFTGLRIGVVTAKALAYAWGVPVAGVSTLEALAHQARGGSRWVCPVMDARNGNVYCAVYDVEDAEADSAPQIVVAPGLRAVDEWLPELVGLLENEERSDDADSKTFSSEAAVTFTGDGVDVYWDDIRRHVGQRAARVGVAFTQMRSGAIAALGRQRMMRGDADDPMGLAPLYLRKSEAERKWEQRESTSPSPL